MNDATLVALIGAGSATLTGIGVAMINAVSRVQRTIGKVNGNGDMMTMQAKLMGWQAEHSAEDARHFAMLDATSAEVKEELKAVAAEVKAALLKEAAEVRRRLEHPVPVEHDERYHDMMQELAIIKAHVKIASGLEE